MDEISFLTRQDGSGVEVQAGGAAPDERGVLGTHRLALPDFEKANYFAAYQKYELTYAGYDIWPETCNQIQPLAITDFDDLTPYGMFLLLKLANDHYLALLPLAGPQTLAWFVGGDGDLLLNVGHLGHGRVEDDIPLLAWAYGDDPYVACHRVWGEAIAHPSIGQSTRWREEKTYPEVFRYLGWCSWTEYENRITDEILADAAQRIAANDIPIRSMLVDDGHLHHDERQLLSFEPNEKFPDGWARLMSSRRPDGLRWIGLWLNFNGYWNGISPDNQLGAVNEHLERLDYQPMPWVAERDAAVTETLTPRNGIDHAFAFYDAMFGAARRQGFDFVKVDNQARALHIRRGTEQPVAGASNAAQAMEAAARLHMDGLINCMAMNSVCIFNTRIGGVTRCSEDYHQGDLPRVRRHVYNSFGNIPWIGQTVWGDHDMYHSCEPYGRMMAASKALAGGPVFLSDAASDFVPARIMPLCYEDGEVLRPLAPGAPLPKSLFIDPYAEPEPFRVIAPLSHGAAAMAVYNLTEPEAPVSGEIRAEDYAHAGAMMQPTPQTWDAPAEGLIAYDWYGRQAHKLDEPHPFTLDGFSDLLFLLIPIRHGWGVIGRDDKFLSPVALDVCHVAPDRVVLRVKEGGPVRIWRASGRPSCTGCEFELVGNGLWRAEMPAGEHEVLLERE